MTLPRTTQEWTRWIEWVRAHPEEMPETPVLARFIVPAPRTKRVRTITCAHCGTVVPRARQQGRQTFCSMRCVGSFYYSRLRERAERGRFSA